MKVMSFLKNTTNRKLWLSWYTYSEYTMERTAYTQNIHNNFVEESNLRIFTSLRLKNLNMELRLFES